MHRYKDSRVWNKARKLMKLFYEISAGFSENQRFGLPSQIRRAACPMMLNFSEGAGRSSQKGFRCLLDKASASPNEVCIAPVIAFDLTLIHQCQVEKIETLIDDLSKMIYGLKRSMIPAHCSEGNLHDSKEPIEIYISDLKLISNYDVRNTHYV